MPLTASAEQRKLKHKPLPPREQPLVVAAEDWRLSRDHAWLSTLPGGLGSDLVAVRLVLPTQVTAAQAVELTCYTELSSATPPVALPTKAGGRSRQVSRTVTAPTTSAARSVREGLTRSESVQTGTRTVSARLRWVAEGLRPAG